MGTNRAPVTYSCSLKARACFRLEGDWLHQTSTFCRAVTGIDINVQTPEAVGAVVRVAVALYDEVAVETDKIFLSSLELLCAHESSEVS